MADKDINETTARHGDGNRDEGKKEPGAHLTSRQERNSAETEKAKAKPSGAHTGKPDRANP